MNKQLLQKGLQRIAFAILAAFTGPVVLMQAFQNEDHPWFWPVFGVGALLALLAIGLGFWGIRLLLNGLLGPKKRQTPS
ncbi:MAG: DUF6095 family protein [Flavobacteriaceae bacterium]